ncbi:hypothetical protein FisN_19Lh152 [Fistulifera solaris]|uniref:DUF6824 domain-containing protein n=1 Tax=Fistulifera solaris TaxID=1519565 RepID=A0A1Z5J6W3_FISSO|nr:hypothetical protein FisN_19Lh152 [Fistulifera solaris]|eukprot:GAX09689.1 hypothetical protein FisN_19Lh152 [Fistulifera solaris]
MLDSNNILFPKDTQDAMADRGMKSQSQPRRGFIVEGRVLNGTRPDAPLGEHDVILGRGLGTYNHVGNVQFRKLVNKHKMRYLASSKVDKPKVARELVHMWKQLDPPGRFLQRADESNLGWIEVCDKKAQEKASQCLRERTPDVLPYYKMIRDNKRRESSADSPRENPSAPTKKRMRLDMEAAASGLARLGSPVPASNIANTVSLSALTEFQAYSDAANLLLKHEIERKVALRRLLLQQLHAPPVHNFSLERMLASVNSNPLHFGRWL